MSRSARRTFLRTAAALPLIAAVGTPPRLGRPRRLIRPMVNSNR